MKRRNGDCGKLRRPGKKSKIAEGILSSPTFVYMKFVSVWLAVLAADFMLEFRFEYLWPCWMLVKSFYDSMKYQGLAFSLFFVLVALTSDMICFLFIPVQFLFFAASTYVWVQYVWHTERGLCVPTVALWLIFIYVEASVRLKELKSTPYHLDLCRPFAAHCIGYPMVTLGYGFKSYVSYRIRLRKQREVAKENEFYHELLSQALPREAIAPPPPPPVPVPLPITSTTTNVIDQSNGNLVQFTNGLVIPNGKESHSSLHQNHHPTSSSQVATTTTTTPVALGNGNGTHLTHRNNKSSNHQHHHNSVNSHPSSQSSFTSSSNQQQPVSNGKHHTEYDAKPRSSSSSLISSPSSIATPSTTTTTHPTTTTVAVTHSTPSSARGSVDKQSELHFSERQYMEQPKKSLPPSPGTLNDYHIDYEDEDSCDASGDNHFKTTTNNLKNHQNHQSTPPSSVSNGKRASGDGGGKKKNQVILERDSPESKTESSVSSTRSPSPSPCRSNKSIESQPAVVTVVQTPPAPTATKKDNRRNKSHQNSNQSNGGPSITSTITKEPSKVVTIEPEQLTKLENEIKKIKGDLTSCKQSEQELRLQLSSVTSHEKSLKSEVNQLQQENEMLQTKLSGLVTGRSQDKQAMVQMDKRLQEEKKVRSTLENQLNQERKNKKDLEAKIILNRSSECTDSCKIKRRDLENEVKGAKRELIKREDQCRLFERENQALHKYKDSQSDSEVLMSALSAMQEKNAHLENSLSSETRLKLDLFSALGDTKRQLEITAALMMQKDKEIEELKSKMAELMACLPSTPAYSQPLENSLVNSLLFNSKFLDPSGSMRDPGSSLYSPKGVSNDL